MLRRDRVGMRRRDELESITVSKLERCRVGALDDCMTVSTLDLLKLSARSSWSLNCSDGGDGMQKANVMSRIVARIHNSR